MIVVVSTAGELPDVESADELGSLKVRVDDGGAVSEAEDVLATAGRLEGEHAWLSIDWLRDAAFRALARNSSAVGADDWIEGFTGMIAFARQHGWVSTDGAYVRAHVERKPRG